MDMGDLDLSIHLRPISPLVPPQEVNLTRTPAPRGAECDSSSWGGLDGDPMIVLFHPTILICPHSSPRIFKALSSLHRWAELRS